MTEKLAAIYAVLDDAQLRMDRARALLRELETADTEMMLTTEELAIALKCSREMVYERARDGTIPSHKIGGALRFSMKEVREATRK